MDFIVSKVAMSICALLVVSILGGLMSGSSVTNKDIDLSRILDDLCYTIEEAGGSGAYGSLLWRAPSMPDGEGVRFELSSDVVRAVCGGHSEVRKPPCAIHTWAWDGSGMNMSRVAGLDDAEPLMGLESGEQLFICPQRVLLDNEYVLLVFVRLAG